MINKKAHIFFRPRLLYINKRFSFECCIIRFKLYTNTFRLFKQTITKSYMFYQIHVSKTGFAPLSTRNKHY